MDAVLSGLVANAVLATLAATVVALVCAVVRRPAVANRAWLLVLLKLVTPPVAGLTVGWAVTPEPVVPQVEPLPMPRVPAPDPVAEDLPEPDAEPFPLVEVAPPPVVVEPTPTPEAAPSLEPPVRPTAWVRPVLLATWIGGACGWWLVTAARVSRFRRVLRTAGVESSELSAAVPVVAARFGLRPPTARLVDAPVSPLVWAGLGWPVVVFPMRLWDSLSADQRDAVLCHELAHLARGDHWVRRLEVVVLGVYWWLPITWLAVRQLRRAEEVCCDAWAVGADPRAGRRGTRTLWWRRWRWCPARGVSRWRPAGRPGWANSTGG